MQKALLLISFVFIWFFTKGQEELKIFGEFSTDQRLMTEKNNTWSWNENRIDLKLEKKIAGKSKFYSDIWFRNIGFYNPSKFIHLSEKNNISPVDLEIREVYAELYGVLSEKLDVKIGRQRIAWGTADKINPTDNINSLDMEDVWDFGRRNASDAIKLTYYFDNGNIEGVFIPFFRANNLPAGDWGNILISNPNFPSTFSLNDSTSFGVVFNGINETIMQPKLNFKENSVFGLKYKGIFSGVDYSLSYIYGLDGFPVPNKADLSIDSLDNLSNFYLKLNTNLIYPRQHIFGLDLAGSIKDIGVWSEIAVFKPTESYRTITYLPDLSSYMSLPFSGMKIIVSDSLMLDDKPFVKYVLGADYTFKNGIYFNIQYIHGFVHERGSENLNNYLLLSVDKKLFNEKLKFSPISGGYVISDFNNITNDYALIYMPYLEYYATDNSSIILGYRYIDGLGKNSFAQFKNYDEIFFKLKYSF